MFKKQVKCSKCGFLTLKRAPGTDEPDQDDTRSQLSKLRMLSIAYLIEVKQKARDKLANNDFDPLTVTCGRNVWSNSELVNQPRNDALRFVNMERKCRFFLPHVPGYAPRAYFEIEGKRSNRRFLITVSILSAIVGAIVGAIIATLISRLIS